MGDERYKFSEVVDLPNQPLLLAGDGDSLANDIVLNVGENQLLLTMTENEYVRLLSAALNGAISTYPEDYNAVIYPLIKAAKMDANFCVAVTDCVNTTPALQAALSTVISQTGIVNPDSVDPITPQMNYRFPAAERDAEINTLVACNLDALWAGTLETVTRLDSMARDFLEQVVAQADKVERVASIIALVPIVGDIVGEIILEFAEIAPDLLNGFNAHSTQAVREEIACALFDAVCSACHYPTYQEYWDYYSSFGISGIQDIAGLGVTALVDYLIGTSTLANKVIYFTMICYGLFVLYLGSTFLNFRGSKWLNIWASFGEDIPTDNWIILCRDCVPPTIWIWKYVDTLCDYHLLAGFTLDIDSGTCGDGPQGFNGLHSYGGAGSAILIVRITPSTHTVLNMRLKAGGNTTGFTIRDIRVQQGAYDLLQPLGAGFSDYNFPTGETGEIIITLQMIGGGFNGVGITEIEIDW